MILPIKFKDQSYLPKITKSGGYFMFRFKESMNTYHHYNFAFQVFKCPLSCRLKHFKEFKNTVFGECNYGCPKGNCGCYSKSFKIYSEVY